MTQPTDLFPAFRPATVLGTASAWSRFGENTHSKHAPPLSPGL
ncbi:MAG TPA: hypothetical protein VFF03_02030 [Rhodocyclaceae bacterium]|nr:hypothetical protein [Rhodocyclaceae bacterium]